MTVNSIVRTVGSITFLYKSHCCVHVCAFDHISMSKCTLEVLNIIVIIFLLHFFNVLYMAFVNCAEQINKFAEEALILWVGKCTILNLFCPRLYRFHKVLFTVTQESS